VLRIMPNEKVCVCERDIDPSDDYLTIRIDVRSCTSRFVSLQVYYSRGNEQSVAAKIKFSCVASSPY